MTIDILLTTYKKEKKDIIKLIDDLKLTGSIIVANTCLQTSREEIYKDNTRIVILNNEIRGVSNNRNILLQNSSADIVSFFDDDCSIASENWEDLVINEFNNHKNANAIRFDVVSNDPVRPVTAIRKSNRLHFKQIRSFGVWGFFYKRKFLIDNNLLFNPKLGSGAEHGFGEDVEFSRRVFDKTGEVYACPDILINIISSESTWFTGTYDEKFFYDMGYSNFLVFRKTAFVVSLYHIIKHKKQYKSVRFFKQISMIKKGIKLAKSEKKRNSCS